MYAIGGIPLSRGEFYFFIERKQIKYVFWEQIYFKTNEYTPDTKERKGHWLRVPPHVGDKLTYFIYCPDTKRIVSRSNIRSADPFCGGIINKRLDPDEDSSIHSMEFNLVLQPFSDSGEKMKDHHWENSNIQNSGESEESKQESKQHLHHREKLNIQKSGGVSKESKQNSGESKESK